jgi:hypothetical protein
MDKRSSFSLFALFLLLFFWDHIDVVFLVTVRSPHLVYVLTDKTGHFIYQ